MTSERLGEIFEGDSADTCAETFPLMLMGPSGGSSMRRPGSERKFNLLICKITMALLTFGQR